MLMPDSARFVSILTQNTVALILAGGRGSRLKQLTDWRAKPAVPFGGKFRIIDFPLSNCLNSGIRKIGVVTQYKAHSLIQHIQRGWGFLRGEFGEFVEIMPAQQRLAESWYKGTADAVYQNIDILRSYHPKFVLVLAGDHIYKMDYGQMLASHVNSQADLTVGCIEMPANESTSFGVMTVDEKDRITGFQEKPKDPTPIPGQPDRILASMGIYVFNADFLYEQLIRDAQESESQHDFGINLIPHIASRYKVQAHRFGNQRHDESGFLSNYWRDVGTVDAYWEANMELTRVTPELSLYDRNWPIWTYQEQLPPAKFIFDEEDRRGMATDSMISGGCIVSGARVRNSLLFSNVIVESGAQIDEAVILPNVRIAENARLRRVIIDKGTLIPAGLVVGEDPEEDARRFHRSEKGITLITPEMLGQPLHAAPR
ncbi:glucose-1-phosphate adenylyltransferase [Thermithiobacillus plumbiphilus]|uniref:Glucose-1-phosphate adenylyltransferase n=1 Tax=Thermithiobacillus plumbiphilus TaxID=1729899 RepID=A0ABU9D4G7_9PROT